MRILAAPILVLIPCLVGQAPPDPAAKARRERLREIYFEDAASYRIFRDATRKEKVELRREPVYVWTNPTQNSTQDGHVFVWTCRGRAEVVGTVFSTPQAPGLRLIHELHSLSTSTLDVDRPGLAGWRPLAPGIELKPIAGAPAPAGSATQRLAQMRALSREFAASAVNDQGRRWELRVLGQPLYRYESTDPEVLDGGLFALVSSAGTDPELMLILEARRDPKSATPTWRFGAARFSDMALTVKHKDAVVFEAPLVQWDAPVKDPLHRYHLNVDRVIPPVEESPAASSPGIGPATTKAREPERKP